MSSSTSAPPAADASPAHAPKSPASTPSKTEVKASAVTLVLKRDLDVFPQGSLITVSAARAQTLIAEKGARRASQADRAVFGRTPPVLADVEGE